MVANDNTEDAHQASAATDASSGSRLPGFLYDNYLQYKRDTDQLATWLITTATTLGHQFVSPSVPEPVQTPAGNKPKRPASHGKGKSRKSDRQRQQQQAAASAGQHAGTNEDRIVTTNQFIALAQTIADRGVAVPKSVLKWTYGNGDLDLLTVSLVTTTALNTARVMEAQLFEQNPSLDGPLEVITMLLHWVSNPNGRAAEIDRLRMQTKSEYDPTEGDVHPQLYLPAYFRLRTLVETWDEISLGMYCTDKKLVHDEPILQFANDLKLLKAMATKGVQYAQHPDAQKFLNVDVFLE
ncbi:hypothetical protein GGF32_000370 [Allomyces javanicus]|nr:hypothetical protein GGF32_000370 [Allomyces javanicus]